jgi:hypothetical protein
MFLQEYDFKIEHIAGKDNIVADGLSRIMAQEDQQDILNLLREEEGEECEVDDTLDQSNLNPNLSVVPSEKYQLFKKAHNSIVGHHGLARTIQNLMKIDPILWKGGENKGILVFIV